LIQNRDQFGYYTVGDYKTYSKLDAILLHERTGHFPKWNFNTVAFGLQDWRIEPAQSLSELYRVRAQQIRDNYDYLVLFYSGGADSANILQTFLKNNIKIDELAHFYSLAGDGNPDSHFNAEITRVAIPCSQKIIEKHPHIRHRVIDLSETIEAIYELPEIRGDFLYQQNTILSPNNFSRAYLRRTIKDYQDLIASGKRVCFIWGSEKPRVYLDNGRYCMKFLDIVDNCVSPLIQQQNPAGWYDELFYWSPDFVSGLIKQGHTVIRALKTWTITEPFFSQQPNPFGSVVHLGKTWYLTSHGINTALYPDWDISTFSSGKTPSPILSPRDSWYLSKSHGSNLRYLAGVQELDQILDKTQRANWKNTNKIKDGIVCCVTDPYYLE